MADIPAFYGRLQKQITMKTDRLPPRERELKPTHFIEVWKDNTGVNRYSWNHWKYAAIYYNTIAIFKIYPKHK